MFLCRFGGDEFIIFGAKRSDEDIEELRYAIDTAIKEQIDSGVSIALTVSIGIASGTVTNDDEATELLRCADQEMYSEKMKTHKE